MTHRILGVLGGMGPQASNRFYELIIQISIEKYGITSNADFPHIILNSIPVPDLVTSQEEEESGVKMVEEEARRLMRAGATALAMPCNTMHLYAERYERAAGLPLISMVQAVVERVRQDKCRCIGLLGSITTMQSDLYTAPLQKNGTSVLLPSENEQQLLGSSIHAVIAGRAGMPEKAHLLSIANNLADGGADAIILGCTELPLLAADIVLPIHAYDSLKILAEQCCAFFYAATPPEKIKFV